MYSVTTFPSDMSATDINYYTNAAKVGSLLLCCLGRVGAMILVVFYVGDSGWLAG